MIRDGVPQLRLICERAVLDGDRQLANEQGVNRAIVRGVGQAGKLRAVGQAREALADEVEARQTSIIVQTRNAQPAGCNTRHKGTGG